MVFLFYAVLNNSCSGSCGLFGATSTTSVSLVVKQPVNEIILERDEFTSIRLDEYVELDVECTGNPDCVCNEGIFPADYYSMMVQDPSIVEANLSGGQNYSSFEYPDFEIMRGEEINLNIKALDPGETNIVISIFFWVEGSTDYAFIRDTLALPFLVIE
ncbi:MAG: hypothetical protein ED557_02075 [Balneola sp.]|nr:MAG: hypothetical protein ED557_02075 [Balneola sp.]